MSEESTATVATGTPRAAPLGVIRWFDRAEGRSLRLLLFGALVSIAGTFELSRVHPAPWTLQGGRANFLRWTLDALNHGAPLLTARQPGSPTLFAAGAGDDQGLYLFVPWLAHLMGWHDPVNLLRWTALLAFATTIALYPWLIRELSGSTLAAVVSPFALLVGLWLMPLGDIYWVSAWAVLTLLPVMLVIDRRWPRWSFPVLLAMLVFASLATAIRSQAGLPVLIAAFLVLIRRPWPAWSRAGAVAVCVVAYVSVSTVGMGIARADRDAALQQRGVATNTGTGHPFWHTVYLGFGYLPNRWNIRYIDGVAYRDVLRRDPKARYLGPAYGRILRDRYFSLVTGDPVYAVGEYGKKLLVSLRPAVPALLILIVVGPWLLLADERRRRWRRDALLLAPAAVVTLISPLLSLPDGGYLLGWLATVLLAAILAAAAVAVPWRVAQGPGPAVSTFAGALRDRRVAVVSAIAAVLVVFTVAVAPGIHASAARWLQKGPVPHVVQPRDATH
jgi:hypothetical protein